MILTGVSDEAGSSLDAQIRATLELGWKHIEARSVQVGAFPGGNLHDIPEQAFELAREKLAAAGVEVYCFASTIANWGKKIDQPFDLSDVHRAIPRMKRLGSRYVRIMSYAVREEGDQMAAERFRRLREITRLFLDAGVQPLHENCMNYGGMGWRQTLEMMEHVPGLKLVFDTGNPVLNIDRSQPAPHPRQDAWEFWTHVREHVEHIHVKDAVWNFEKNEARYTGPGEGQGRVRDILRDAFARGYKGAIAIEPHVAVVFHDASVKSSEAETYRSYVDYGRRLMKLIEEIRAGAAKPA